MASNPVSAHSLSDEEFLDTPASRVIETGRPTYELVIHAGVKLFTSKFVVQPHMRLPGVTGSVDVVLDWDLDGWESHVKERE